MTAVADHGGPGAAPGTGGCAEAGLALVRAGIEEIDRSCAVPELRGSRNAQELPRGRPGREDAAVRPCRGRAPDRQGSDRAGQDRARHRRADRSRLPDLGHRGPQARPDGAGPARPARPAAVAVRRRGAQRPPGLGSRVRNLAPRHGRARRDGTFRARCAAARTGRRVTLRACYAALREAFNEVSADPAPLTRSRGQVMATRSSSG